MAGMLPSYGEIALGNLGRLADRTALIRFDAGELTILRMAPVFEAWLHGASSDGIVSERSDCARLLRQNVRCALARSQPERQTASRVENGIVERYEILALPLLTQWGFPVVLVYVGEPSLRSSLIERVYQSTHEGIVAFAPMRDENGTLCDLQIVTLNAGAAHLMRRPASAILWRPLSALQLGTHESSIKVRLLDLVETGGSDNFELDYVWGGTELFLKVSASVLDDLLVVTLVDITELRTREASFRLMFEANPLPMWVVEAGSLRFLDTNMAAVEHYGYDRQRFLAMSMIDLLPDEERDVAWVRLMRRGTPYDADHSWRHVRADASVIQVMPYARPLTLRGEPAMLVTVIDVTQRQLAAAELQRTRSFLDTVVENIPAVLFVKDAVEHRFLLVNRAGEELFGVPRAELLGKTSHDLFPQEIAARAIEQDRQVVEAGPGQAFVEERVYETRSKGRRLLHMKKLAVSDEEGQPRYLLGVGEDVTERRAIEARIVHMAHHDTLTDLPNRSFFRERLTSVLESQSGDPGAVLYIDLDGFKGVNDTLGHAAGDALLRAVADRLRACVREEDTVARLGGDEFVVLQACAPSPEAASRLAARLIEQLTQPFPIQGQTVTIGASLGIARLPSDGSTPDLLLHNADLALYQAKAEKRGTFRFFETEMNDRAQGRRAIERDLRQAFTTGSLELFYQPLLNLREGRVSACEALLRWRHPERGFVSPAEFIPIAEETGLITPIGEWVLRRACLDAAAWPDEIKVAVNLSPVQFRQSELVSMVVSALAVSGLRPDRLELEITESVLLADSETNLAILHQLRALGVRIAMDDFGTGYSSLSYLRTFPFDKIKIDQSFVRELGISAHCAAIVRAVIRLGIDLGITTVAEGVETAEQRDHLQREGCDEMQGYLFSRPVPLAELKPMLTSVSQFLRAA
jgi:diguanylate cyclase (GGDEF)-like protein/PAS domain S-box-containing protein